MTRASNSPDGTARALTKAPMIPGAMPGARARRAGRCACWRWNPCACSAVSRPSPNGNPGGWILDAGVLQSGICRFTFHGKAGDTLTMRYSDLINGDGSLDTKSLSGFIKNYDSRLTATSNTTMNLETWHTTFAYHGFRYVEISGSDWEPELEDVEVWSLCNDFADRGMLVTSDDMINKIQEITLNAVRSVCFYSIAADTARENLLDGRYRAVRRADAIKLKASPCCANGCRTCAMRSCPRACCRASSPPRAGASPCQRAGLEPAHAHHPRPPVHAVRRCAGTGGQL